MNPFYSIKKTARPLGSLTAVAVATLMTTGIFTAEAKIITEPTPTKSVVCTAAISPDATDLTVDQQISLLNAAKMVNVPQGLSRAEATDFKFGIDPVNNYAAIVSYTGNDVDVVIPDEVEYENKIYPITKILTTAFVGKMTMKTLTFGKNIKETEELVFAYCTQLTTVNINEGFEKFGPNTFYLMCSNLKSIKFPSTLKEIGEQAFKATKITGEVILPASLEILGPGAFMGNPITGFYFEDDKNPKFKSIDGVLYSKDGTRLVCFPPGLVEAKTVLPAGIKEIDSYALYGNTTLKEVVIPSSVEKIGKWAFGGCNLTSINIPENVSDIAEGIVYNNKGLTTITVDAGNKTFKVEDSKYLVNTVTKDLVMATMFQGDFIVPAGVEKIKGYIATKNTEITSLKAPASVKEIGDYAFEGCSGIATIEFPGIESIGNFAFQNVGNVKSIVFPNTLKSIGVTAFGYANALEEAILPSSLETLGSTSFYQCAALKKVAVPGTVKEFGQAIFYQCPQLYEASLGEGMPLIPDQLFNGCAKLEKVNIPTTIKSIERAAFYGTHVLYVDLPEGLKTLGQSCFYSSWLQYVTIPNSVEFIDEFAFSFAACQWIKCGTGLKTIAPLAFQALKSCNSIELNEGLETLGSKSIFSCSIKEITIPSTVTTIGDSVFVKTRLEKMTNLATTPQPLKSMITGDPWENWQIYDTMILYVPENSVDLYKAANFWKEYKNIKPIPTSGIEDIEDDVAQDEVVAIYGVDGRLRDNMGDGFNIVRYKSGKVEKIFKK